MRFHHHFGGIGNQFPTGQTIFHAGMVHGNAVANRNRTDFKRYAAGSTNAFFNCLSNDIQMHMSGDDFVVAIDNADKRLFHIFPADADGMQQCPLPGALYSLFYHITSHFNAPLVR